MHLHNGLKEGRKNQFGINMVDLMMWLVIAALLLAAALQGINYYQQAAWAQQAKTDLAGTHSWAAGQVSLTSDVPNSIEMQSALNDGSLKLSGTGTSRNVGLVATSGSSKYCIGVQATTLSENNIFYSSSDAPSDIKRTDSLPASCGEVGEPAAPGREVITWKPSVNLGIGIWDTALISADGSKMFAVKRTGSAYYSDDSGNTWSESSGMGTTGYVTDGVMSDDGMRITVSKYNDVVRVSNDGGKTFTAGPGNPYGASSVSASSDNKVQVVTKQSSMFKTQDYGLTWSTILGGLPNVPYEDVAVSGDGAKIFSVSLSNGNLYKSVNGGASWVVKPTPKTVGLVSVAISKEGNSVVVLQGNGTGTTRSIFVSSDEGENWQTPKLPVQTTTGSWQDVSISASGSRMIVAKYGSPMVTSSDYGATWDSRANAGSADWMSVNTSDDGGKIIAGRANSTVFVGSY